MVEEGTNTTQRMNSVKYKFYSFSHSSIENINLSENNMQEHQKESISRMRQPISTMTKTKIFNDIYNKICHKSIVILHCWGVAGSGKSQITRKLAEMFPFDENSNNIFIKWHIRCKDCGEFVKDELQTLAGKIAMNGHISQTKHEAIVNDIAKGHSDCLISTLVNCGLPVVIIFEDPVTRQCINILQDFFRCVKKRDNLVNDVKSILHVYITSRKRDLIFLQNEIDNMDCYIQKKITGFNEDESVAFLSEGLELSSEDKVAAVKIFNRFSGLPLGLHAARAYCHESFSYKEYLDILQKNEKQIVKGEFDTGKDKIEEYEEHVFQAIVFPFHPNNNGSEDAILFWKILSCISYFNYECIPRHAIQYCCDKLTESFASRSKMMNKKFVGDLITKLIQYGMCVEPVEKENNLVVKISFHEVISHSFRLSSFQVGSFDPLNEAVSVMSGLVTKDFRDYPRFQNMFKIRRHAETLFSFVESEKSSFKSEDLLSRALLSHIYDATATIMFYESPTLFVKASNKYFGAALKWLLKDLDIIDFLESEDIEHAAKELVQKSKEMSKSLPPSFTLDYASKLDLCITEKTKEFFESKVDSKTFRKIEAMINDSATQKELIQQFQQCNLFLPDSLYREIFYAERVSSILSSWSRVFVNSGTQEKKQSNRMLELSRCIAEECHKSCSTPILLLIQQFTHKTGKIALLLKKKTVADCMEAIKLSEEMLSCNSDKIPLYENGMLKEMFGPSQVSTRIYFLRYIVRANARLLGFKHDINMEKANNYCEELLKLAKENAAKVSNGIDCLIYCAKYFAAKKEYQQSIECLEFFFDVASVEAKPRFSVQRWSVYNYARVVCSYASATADSREKAARRCQHILFSREDMGEDLRKRLKNCLLNLTDISTSGSLEVVQ